MNSSQTKSPASGAKGKAQEASGLSTENTSEMTKAKEYDSKAETHRSKDGGVIGEMNRDVKRTPQSTKEQER